MNIEEPDAVMQNLGRSKGSFPGYNLQVSTDTKTQLIVGGEVVRDRNDEKQFINQYSNVENILSRDKERRYVADSGYNSHDTIEQVYQEKVNAYIANRNKVRPTKEKLEEGVQLSKDDFCYDRENDTYVCPMGRQLYYVSMEKNKSFHGKKYRSKSCSDCTIKHLCLAKNNKTGYREIRRDHREELINGMRNKIESAEGKAILFRRQTTVEAVIGNIKSNMGYSRFRLKGIVAVNAEFMLMCIGHNLNKLFKMQGSSNIAPFFNIIRIMWHKLEIWSFARGHSVYFAQV